MAIITACERCGARNDQPGILCEDCLDEYIEDRLDCTRRQWVEYKHIEERQGPLLAERETPNGIRG